MEKNVKLAALASTAILGVTAVMPVIANADTPANGTLNAAASTNATVSFKQNANNSDPVGPVDSNGSELGSDGSGVTGETGNLTIDYVTPNLNFGDHELDAKNHTTGVASEKNSAGDAVYSANYLNGGTDLSNQDPAGTKSPVDQGTGDSVSKFQNAYNGNVWMQFTKRQAETEPAGSSESDQTINGVKNTDDKNYEISAQMTNFTGTTQQAKNQTLKGAQITFGDTNGNYYFDGSNQNANDGSYKHGEFTLTPNDTKTVFTTTGFEADGTTKAQFPGMGTHDATWAPSDINLTVPQATQNKLSTGDYHALIHWMIAPTV